MSLDALRARTARRAVVVAGSTPPATPMVVAACALLIASGRADFTENEIEREVERLSAVLRSHYGFTEQERCEGLRAWVPVRKLIRHDLAPSTYAIWVRPLRPAGLAGGRLWLTGPDASVHWARRRYRTYITEAVALTGLECSVAFMGLDEKGEGDGSG